MRYVPYLLLVLCVGCQTSPQKKSDAEIRAKLHTVNVADGISESEAETIGQCYFDKNIGCGVYVDVRDDGDKWIVDGAIGAVAVPGHFYIDKRTGKIFGCTFGPNYGDPFAIDP
ncbi:MAG TPA: hypothetical protein VMH87_06750 [Pseudomonadales bacterium]|nr:hypothetical protein [Pseudomonadales bacterium]